MRSFFFVVLLTVVSCEETLETWWCSWWWFGACLWKAGPPTSSYLMQNCGPVFKSLVFPSAD